MKKKIIFNKSLLIISFILCFLILITSQVSFAQIPQGASASSEQEAIQLREKMEALREQRKGRVDLKEEVESTKEFPAETLDKRFFVKKILIEGSSVTKLEKQFIKITRPYVNREASFKEILELADKLTAEYKKHGFITSQAYVPPQTIKDGIVRIEVFEGTLGEVDIEGNKDTKKKYINNYFKRNIGKPLNAKSIYRALLKLSQNPDRTIKAVIIPGKEPKTSNLNLQVQDKRSMHLGAEWDNLGSKYSGSQRMAYTLRDSNLTGYDDPMIIRYYRTVNNSNFFAASASYARPLTDFGTKVGGGGSYVNSKLGKDFEDLRVKGTASEGYAYIRQEIYDGEVFDVNADVRFDAKESTQKLLDTMFSHDSLRILSGGLDITETDGVGRTFFRVDYSQGFAGLWGAMRKKDPWASRLDAGGQFVKGKLSLVRANKLPWGMFLLSSTNYQYTPDILVTSEQVRIGGAFTVRGYPEGDSLGDYGFNTTFEVRIPIYLIPKSFNIKGINIRDSIQYVAFLDYGEVHLRSPQMGEDRDRELLGVGAGMRLSIKKNVYGRFDMGWPLGDHPVNEGGGPRMHFALGVEF